MRISTLGLCAFLAACSSDPDSDSGASPLPEGPDTVPADDEILFASDDFELGPGEEKYMCWAGNLPEDRDVVLREISGDYGPGTHHVFFAWTLVPEPEGMTECPVLFKTSWIPIYLGGVNTSPLTVPEGAGIDLERGKQVLLQLHLQNTTAEPITNKVTMHMKLRDPDEPFTPAGIFGMDNRDIDLPPNTEAVSTSMTCAPGKEMEVFSVLGHMHKLGRSLEVSRDGAVVFEQEWKFEEQPITPFQLSVKSGEVLGLTCTHRNPNATPVTYGESSDTEMCATVFYYTPYDQLGGCINVPAAPAAP